MDKVEHGQKTIKGRIDSELELKMSKNGNQMLFFNVHATDNNIYEVMTMKNCEGIHSNFSLNDFVVISGNHQTEKYYDDMKEKIVFASVSRWEPAWKITAELINALNDICGKLLNAELGIQDRLDEIGSECPNDEKLQMAVLSDTFRRHLLCLQILNHECRPLEDGQDVKLIYDGSENCYGIEICTAQNSQI